MRFSFHTLSPKRQKWLMVIASLFCSLFVWWILFLLIPSPLRTLVDMTIASMGNGIPTKGEIVIVAIDDKTLDTFTQTNSRFVSLGSEQYQVYAETLKYIRESGARAVGFDIVFANATRWGAAEYFRDQLLTLPSVIGTSMGTIVPPECLVTRSLAGRYTHSGSESEECLEITDSERKAREVAPSSIFSGVTLWAVNQALTFDYALVRPSLVTFAERSTPNLWEALVQKIASWSVAPERSSDRIVYFSQASWERAYSYYSLSDVHAGIISPEAFRDKIVLIGESGTLTQDLVFTPLHPNQKMSGVETHAHYIESRLRGIESQDMPIGYILIISLLIAMTLVSGVILLPRYTFLMLCVSALWSLWAYIASPILHVSGYILLPFTWIVLLSFVTFFVSYAFRYLLSDRQKKQLRTTFSRYLDDRVITLMEKNGELALQNTRQEIAVVFSDIEGFSTYSEKLGTQKTFALMNAYLSKMTEILQSHGATLDKYIGDAVMGFLGAPHRLSPQESCTKAVAIITDWQRSLPELNQSLRAQWLLQSPDGEELPDIRFRVGVSYGDAIVGNIGSKDRVSYTAMGDTINLASRLEAINKYYGTYLMLSDDVYIHLDATLQEHCSLIDCIAVKWKSHPIKIYEYFPEGKGEADKNFDQAFAPYFRSEFSPEYILRLEGLACESKKARFLIDHGHEVSKKYGDWIVKSGEVPVFQFHEK